MPEGNPEAYMEQGVPPEEAMAMAGEPPMDPMMGGSVPGPMGPMGPPEPPQDMMMAMLLQAVTQKWGGAEAQIAGEKDMLMQTLMQLAMPAPAFGAGDMVEGAPPMMGPEPGMPPV